MAFRKTGTPEDAQLGVVDREEAQKRIAERLPEDEAETYRERVRNAKRED